MEFLIVFATLITIAGTKKGYTHCSYKGKKYANGAIWVAETDDDKFKVKCNVLGNSYFIEPVGCITPEGNELALGEAKYIGNYIWRCSKLGKHFAKIESFLRADADCDEGHKH
ncbi:hypothetical protein GCK32_020060, partial [Trichostrongylus colubriformis]